ncbi:hypothetical protein QUF70_06485 [Desulfobacterales bacterium HSG17]|nr:hypothetical protein [Desulfobacterales bacterium HSG17]
MKKWRCTVCGYVHTGNEPPDKCPVCGADKTLFEEIEEKVEAVSETVEQNESSELSEKKEPDRTGVQAQEGKESASEVQTGETQTSEVQTGETQTSEVQTGETQTSKTQTNETQTGETSIDESSESKPARIYNMIVKQLLKHHAHPISVHFPNGVLPMSVIFIVLAVAFEMKEFEIVGFYSMIFVLIILPFVLFTGYLEWKNKYGGHLTKIFLTKIICAVIVTGTAICAVAWRFVDPKVMDIYSPDRWTYVLLCLTMLGAAVVAGMIGGKLVFKD